LSQCCELRAIRLQFSLFENEFRGDVDSLVPRTGNRAGMMINLLDLLNDLTLFGRRFQMTAHMDAADHRHFLLNPDLGGQPGHSRSGPSLRSMRTLNT